MTGDCYICALRETAPFASFAGVSGEEIYVEGGAALILCRCIETGTAAVVLTLCPRHRKKIRKLLLDDKD